MTINRNDFAELMTEESSPALASPSSFRGSNPRPERIMNARANMIDMATRRSMEYFEQWAKTKWIQYNTKDSFTILVGDRETEWLYLVLEDWLYKNSTPQESNILTAHTDRENKTFLFPYSARNAFDIDMDGWSFSVSEQREDEESSGGSFSTRLIKQYYLTTAPENREKLERLVMETIPALYTRAEEERKYVWGYVTNQHGGWDGSRVPLRPENSVILPEGQLERIFADVDKFIASEDRYNSIGTPWHRGYLFHGKAGTGKSSLAKIIASKYRRDIFIFSPADVKSDSDMLSFISSIHDNSILLIEDIDVYNAATERNETGRGATMSALLNALDGVTTPHGLITIITSNHASKLDEALVRPGRVSLTEEIGSLQTEGISRLLKLFYGQDADTSKLRQDLDMVPAYIINMIEQNTDSIDECIAAINNLGE